MPRILIVEDDENERLLYREELESEGYEVVEACDGREAVACVQTHHLDAVVLDISMPGMDGLQTLERVHDLNRRLPVILNSAYAVYKEQFVSWLADAYVTKSSNSAALKAAVRAALVRNE